MKTYRPTDLSGAAYDLADEIHAGVWKHVEDLRTKPAPDCAEIVEELKRRCPGHSLLEYKRAIATGLFEAR